MSGAMKDRVLQSELLTDSSHLRREVKTIVKTTPVIDIHTHMFPPEVAAPRPVFISSCAKGDGWVDAKGMFLAAVGAGPVYKLLGKKDLGTAEFPPLEKPLTDGDVAFRQHSSGHTPGPNWPTFLTFASRYLKTSAARVRRSHA